jgi:hypothetical protein
MEGAREALVKGLREGEKSEDTKHISKNRNMYYVPDFPEGSGK